MKNQRGARSRWENGEDAHQSSRGSSGFVGVQRLVAVVKVRWRQSLASREEVGKHENKDLFSFNRSDGDGDF